MMKIVIDIPEDVLKRTVFYREFRDLNDCITTIKALEKAIPLPKGKWIEVDIHNCHATLKCSVCDRVIESTFTFGEYSYEDIKRYYPYCHCGADMRGDEE